MGYNKYYKEIMKNLLIITCLLIMCMPGISLADYLYVDNFNKISDRNLNGGAFGTTEWGTNGSSSGEASISYDSDNAFGGFGNSLKFDYTIHTNGDVGMIWMNLKGDPAQAVNLNDYSYLSFWVKGAVGGEVVRFRMKEQATLQESPWVDIRNYLPGGKITTSWQKVVIPMTTFLNPVFDETTVGTFMIKAEYDGFGIGAHSGTIYLDEIILSTGTSLIYVDTMEVDELILEPTWGFDTDSLNLNVVAQQGNGGQSYKTNTYETDHTNYKGQCSYKLNQTRSNTANSYAQTVWVLGTGGTPPPLNVSACDKLVFAIKSEFTRNIGEGPRIRLDDVGYDENLPMPAIGNTWTLVTNNIGDFGVSLNTSDIRSFRLETGTGVGTHWTNSVWVDEIKLIDTISPQAPTNIKVNGVKLTNNFSLALENHFVSTVFSNEIYDASLEAVVLEYRVNKGDWKIVDFNYNTTNQEFTNIWYASGLKRSDMIDIRISSMDCAGNKGSTLFTNCHVPSASLYAFCDMSVNPPIEYKLYLKDQIASGYTNNIGGSGARKTKEETWGALLFDIDDNFAYQVTDNSYYYILAIEYFDIFDILKGKQFVLEYDDRGKTNREQLFLPDRKNTHTWKTNFVIIDDAYWGNRIPGPSDFLIKGAGVIYLRKVTVYMISSSASAVSLKLSASDSEMGVGTLNKIKVEAINDFGFPAINASGTVNVSVVNGSAILSKENVSLINGVGYFYISSGVEETVQIKAEKAGLNGDMYPATFILFYGLNQSKKVSITLGNPVIRNGISEYVEPDPDKTKITNIYIGGEYAYRTPDPEWSYMLFDIDNDFIYDRNENDGYIYDIIIEYYDIYTSTDDDENKKYLLLFYDNIGSPDIGTQGWYDPKECDQKIIRQNSETWKTFTFSIMDPWFYDRIDGRGDFILKAFDPIYIKSVIVSKRNYYHLIKNEDLKIESANANLFIEKNSTLANHYIIPFNLLALPDIKTPLYGMAYSINNKNLVSGCDFLAFNENRSKLDNLYLKKTAQLELIYKLENLSSEINENNLSVYFYNNKWEKKGGNLDTTLKKLSLNVNHLSFYGIFESNTGKDFLIQWEYNPFSPNNDGIMDRGFLHVVLPDNVKNLRVFIYNLKGAFVKELPKQQTSTGQIFEWDGKDQRNKRVPIGPYIYQVEYDDKVYNGLVGVVR